MRTLANSYRANYIPATDTASINPGLRPACEIRSSLVAVRVAKITVSPQNANIEIIMHRHVRCLAPTECRMNDDLNDVAGIRDGVDEGLVAACGTQPRGPGRRVLAVRISRPIRLDAHLDTRRWIDHVVQVSGTTSRHRMD